MVSSIVLFTIPIMACVQAQSLVGKTYLVTGATDGIGQHTAIRLAKAGANLLLHGRNWERLERTKSIVSNVMDKNREIKSFVKGFCHDLQTIAGAKQLAVDVLQTTSELDGLINNAGVFQDSLIITDDGLESTFAINTCAPFILCKLLLPLLRKSHRAKILNVSSISQGGELVLNNLQYQHGGFSSYSSYAFSKLCIAAMSHELALRISPEDALVLCCDPGTVNTKMLLAGWGYCGIDIEDANDEFSLISAPFDEAHHGKYFVGCRPTRCHRDVYNESRRLELWQFLENILSPEL
jgi:NAD(P)-dependent dehydrogenase (short-subunit alcohol dehydrogenase family)